MLNNFQNNCGDVKCTVISPFCDNGTPHYENGNHSCCWHMSHPIVLRLEIYKDVLVLSTYHYWTFMWETIYDNAYVALWSLIQTNNKVIFRVLVSITKQFSFIFLFSFQCDFFKHLWKKIVISTFQFRTIKQMKQK